MKRQVYKITSYMLTQIQGFGTTDLNELSLSSLEFDELMNDADNCSHPMGAVYTSTVQILRYAFWLGKQKAELTKAEFKELLKKIGWKGEEKRYLDVYEAFKSFLPHQLAQIEPRTIFQIAGNLNKYHSVIVKIAINLGQITQDMVRGYILQCRKPRAAKTQEEPSIWRAAPGGRVFQAPPMYDEVTGVIIEQIIKAEGRSVQSILAEALLALKEKKEGILVYKSQVGDLENIETNLFTEVQESQESIVQDLQASSESSTANSDEELLSNYLELDDTASYDSSTSAAPADEIWYNDEDLVVEDTLGYEPQVKIDDEIEDYELLNSTPAQQEEKTPVDLLIEAYRSASCWEEIQEILNSYSEFEQQAWFGLTPLERRRVIEIMRQ